MNQSATHFFFETPSLRVVVDTPHLRTHDPFEGMEHRSGMKTFDGAAPVRARAEVDGIVITIGETTLGNPWRPLLDIEAAFQELQRRAQVRDR